ncbi:MAG: META domain-containing protein [Clostridiales bacterium]|nr:META domain-containing protein [Clostridiales bacterium]
MTLKSYFSVLLAAFFISSSCSTIKKVTGGNSSTTTVSPKTNKASSGKKKVRGRHASGTSSQTLSKTITGNGATTQQFSQVDSLSIISHLNGEWYFETVAGNKVTGDEDRPSITFENTTARFYASNGCNYFNGDFHVTGHNAISFDNIIMTANHCEETPWGDYISSLWNVGKKFYTTNRGAEEYLDLRDSNDRTLATLHRHALNRLNGMWTVSHINGSVIPQENAPTIVIDLIERTIHGNTGCNLFRGTIYQSPDTDSSIQFQDMSVTRMSCPNSTVERNFLVAMEQVETASLSTDDQVTFFDKNGMQLVTLLRSQL